MLVKTLSLLRCPFVGLDLETTGLSVKSDRIVQVGIADTTSTQNVHLDCLVNPEIAIPPLATRFHGLTDAHVAGEQTFSHVHARIAEIIHGKLVVGYNIGFDLAMLRNECARNGLAWHQPSALCLKRLGQIILGPEKELMIADLESLALFFDIPVTRRHSAIGDALMSAQIFSAMRPFLRERRIISLADAERASAKSEHWRQDIANAGWVDIISDQMPPLSAFTRRIDLYPFTHQSSDVMRYPPLILPPSAMLVDAAQLMNKEKADCVFIKSGSQVVGVVSERDIVQAAAHPLDQTSKARALKLSDIMSSPVITVQDDAYLYTALGRIDRLGLRHLGVINEVGDLVGWISCRELVRQRSTSARALGDEIASAQSPSALTDIISRLPSITQHLLEEGVRAQNITNLISSEHCALLRQAASLAEQLMIKKGLGPAPSDFCVLMLGSAARGESMLAADQDHAIIFDTAKTSDPLALREWYQSYGKVISDILAQAGVPLCSGGVMSQNAPWCRSIEDWGEALFHWARRAAADDVLAIEIFFDFIPAYGQRELASALRAISQHKRLRRAEFLKRIAGNIANPSTHLNIFGQLKSYQGRCDIKHAVLLPITEVIRTLALARGIDETNTSRRVERLRLEHNIPSDIFMLPRDLHFAQHLVLKQQVHDLSVGLKANNSIDLKSLDRGCKRHLTEIVSRLSYLPDILRDALFDV